MDQGPFKDVGELADAVGATAGNYAKALTPLKALASPSLSMKLGSLSLMQVDEIIKAAEAAVPGRQMGAADEIQAGTQYSAESVEEGGSKEAMPESVRQLESNAPGKGPTVSAPNAADVEKIRHFSFQVVAGWLQMIATYKRISGSKIAPAAQALITRSRDAALQSIEFLSGGLSEAPHASFAAALVVLAESVELFGPDQLAQSTEAIVRALRDMEGRGHSFDAEAAESVSASIAGILSHTTKDDALGDVCGAALSLWGATERDKEDPWARVNMPREEHRHMRTVLLAFSAAARGGCLGLDGNHMPSASQDAWLVSIAGAVAGSRAGSARLYAAAGILRAQSVQPSSALRRALMSFKPLREIVISELEAALEVGEKQGLVKSEQGAHHRKPEVKQARTALSERGVHAGAAAILCYGSLAVGGSSPSIARAASVWMCRGLLGGVNVLGGGDGLDRLEGHLKSPVFDLGNACCRCIEFHLVQSLKAPKGSGNASQLVASVLDELLELCGWNLSFVRKVALLDASGQATTATDKAATSTRATAAATRLAEATAMSFASVVALVAPQMSGEDVERALRVGSGVCSINGVNFKWSRVAVESLGRRVRGDVRLVKGLEGMMDETLSSLSREGPSNAVEAAGDATSKDVGGDLIGEWTASAWEEEAEGRVRVATDDSPAVCSGSFYLLVCLSKEMMRIKQGKAGESDEAKQGKAGESDEAYHEGKAGESDEAKQGKAGESDEAYHDLYSKALHLALELMTCQSTPLSDPSHDVVRELITSPHARLSLLSISFFPLYWARAMSGYPRTSSLRTLVASLVSLIRVIDESEGQASSPTPGSDSIVGIVPMAATRPARLALVSSCVKSLTNAAVSNRYLKLARMQAALIPHVCIECIHPVLDGIEDIVDAMPQHQRASFLNFIFNVVNSGMDFVRRPFVTEWYLGLRSKAGFRTMRSKL